MGEVGLPGLVRQLGFEPDVAAAGAFLRLWDDQAGTAQFAADRRFRDDELMLLGEVPGDGRRTGVMAVGEELGPKLEDQLDGGLRRRGR